MNTVTISLKEYEHDRETIKSQRETIAELKEHRGEVVFSEYMSMGRYSTTHKVSYYGKDAVIKEVVAKASKQYVQYEREVDKLQTKLDDRPLSMCYTTGSDIVGVGVPWPCAIGLGFLGGIIGYIIGVL